MTRITVLLAEDHLIVREGFRSLLKAESDIEVVGEAQTGRQAVALAKKLRPAVIVMDIAMPLLNGLEATRQIRQALPGAKVLMLSAHSDDAYVEQAIAFGAARHRHQPHLGAAARWPRRRARQLYRQAETETEKSSSREMHILFTVRTQLSP